MTEPNWSHYRSCQIVPSLCLLLTLWWQWAEDAAASPGTRLQKNSSTLPFALSKISSSKSVQCLCPVLNSKTCDQHSVLALLDLGYEHLNVVQPSFINSKKQGHAGVGGKHERDSCSGVWLPPASTWALKTWMHINHRFISEMCQFSLTSLVLVGVILLHTCLLWQTFLLP